MKRSLVMALAGLTAAAAFGGLVYAVLVAAHVSEPAVTTVQGMTPRRVWATSVVLMALTGVVIGALAVTRPAGLFGINSRPPGAVVAVVLGLVAALNGALNLSMANGGPGTGNGVVGGAAAFVLGLAALALGGLARARRKRSTLQTGR